MFEPQKYTEWVKGKENWKPITFYMEKNAEYILRQFFQKHVHYEDIADSLNIKRGTLYAWILRRGGDFARREFKRKSHMAKKDLSRHELFKYKDRIIKFLDDPDITLEQFAKEIESNQNTIRLFARKLFGIPVWNRKIREKYRVIKKVSKEDRTLVVDLYSRGLGCKTISAKTGLGCHAVRSILIDTGDWDSRRAEAYTFVEPADRDVARICQSLRARIYRLMNGKGMSENTYRAIGCTKETLMFHLECQFDKGMTFDNYGKCWHIDHIIPLSWFDANIKHERKIAINYINLRPLLASENISKSDNFEIGYKEIQKRSKTCPASADYLRLIDGIMKKRRAAA